MTRPDPSRVLAVRLAEERASGRQAWTLVHWLQLWLTVAEMPLSDDVLGACSVARSATPMPRPATLRALGRWLCALADRMEA